jgi:hypothetical protein
MPANFTHEKYTVAENTGLSDLDKAYMVINYPRKHPHPSAPRWTLDRALDVAGVPRDVRRDWNASNVRIKFHKYISRLREGEFLTLLL